MGWRFREISRKYRPPSAHTGGRLRAIQSCVHLDLGTSCAAAESANDCRDIRVVIGDARGSFAKRLYRISPSIADHGRDRALGSLEQHGEGKKSIPPLVAAAPTTTRESGIAHPTSVRFDGS